MTLNLLIIYVCWPSWSLLSFLFDVLVVLLTFGEAVYIICPIDNNCGSAPNRGEVLIVKFICLVPLELESFAVLSSFRTTAGDPFGFLA